MPRSSKRCVLARARAPGRAYIYIVLQGIPMGFRCKEACLCLIGDIIYAWWFQGSAGRGLRAEGNVPARVYSYIYVPIFLMLSWEAIAFMLNKGIMVEYTLEYGLGLLTCCRLIHEWELVA